MQRYHPDPLVQAGTAALLVATALALAACDQPDAATPPPAPPPVPVRVETVRLEAAQQVQRYAAVVRPRIEADIGFRVGGKVTARLVEVGTRVDVGAPLAQLDTTPFDKRVRAALAQLRSAKAVAENANDEFARYARLQGNGWSTRQEFERRRAALETAEAAVRQIEAQLALARDEVRYASLRADAPGLVTAVQVEPGQVVAEGQTVFKIARAGEMEAVADVPEAQVGLLEGAVLSTEVWSLPEVAIPGRLRELSPIADAATRTYRARVTLIDPPPGAQLGMTATVVVTRPGTGRIARLPATALTKRGSDPALWVLNPAGNGLELRPVALGAYLGETMTVVSGVEEGERVVTAGVHKLDAAQKVRIWTEPVR